MLKQEKKGIAMSTNENITIENELFILLGEQKFLKLKMMKESLDLDYNKLFLMGLEKLEELLQPSGL